MAANVATCSETVVRVLSFLHSNSDLSQLRVSDPFVYMEYDFPLKEMHCEMPLLLLSLALVITACCDHIY